MKLGILKTDNVRPELAVQFGEYPDMFTRLFKETQVDLEIITYEVINHHYPRHIDEVDAYLITGSSASVYEEHEWIRRLSRFIESLHLRRKKTIGICFGHQIVAHTLGGKTEKSSRGWHIGTRSHSLNMTGEKVVGHRDTFNLIFSHQDQVVLPAEGSRTLATTEGCPIAMSLIENHILTIQGHPEFDIEYARNLISIRKHLFGASLYKDGIDSLDKPNDRGLVAQWLIDFIDDTDS